jgi:hypothetical protein
MLTWLHKVQKTSSLLNGGLFDVPFHDPAQQPFHPRSALQAECL